MASLLLTSHSYLARSAHTTCMYVKFVNTLYKNYISVCFAYVLFEATLIGELFLKTNSQTEMCVYSNRVVCLHFTDGEGEETSESEGQRPNGFAVKFSEGTLNPRLSSYLYHTGFLYYRHLKSFFIGCSHREQKINIAVAWK